MCCLSYSTGVTITSAKNNTAEQAIRDLTIKSMNQMQKAMETNATGDDGAGAETSKKKSEMPVTALTMHLASFALYELFNGWQKEGHVIPGFKTDGPPTGIHKMLCPPPLINKSLPKDASKMHPASLLVEASIIIYRFNYI